MSNQTRQKRIEKPIEHIRIEKTIYQPNKLSGNLIMLVIAINVYFVLQVLNVIDKDFHIGVHILSNIFLTLVLFLGSVRVKVYQMNWSYVILGFGVFQILRGLFLIPAEVTGSLETTLTFALVFSGVLAIAAAVISIQKITRQRKYIEENEFYVENLAK